MKLKIVLISAILFPVVMFSQTDVMNALKGGELILSSISVFKGKIGTSINSDVIETICFKKKSLFLKMYTFCLPNYPNYLFIFTTSKQNNNNIN